jgi:uroporphyrinogen-III decarboxylase
VFESHAEYLGPQQFATFCLPYLKEIRQQVQEQLTEKGIPPVPMVMTCSNSRTRGRFFKKFRSVITQSELRHNSKRMTFSHSVKRLWRSSDWAMTDLKKILKNRPQTPA